MKLITMLESTKKIPRSGMIKNLKKIIPGKRTIFFIQLQAKDVSRETEVKMEWSIYSGSKYTLWSSNIEDEIWR